MTKRGKEAAAYGAALPEFGSATEAKKALLVQRDDALRHLREVTDKAGVFSTKGASTSSMTLESPDCLLLLERWYFEALERRALRRLGTTKTRLEEAFGFLVGALLVKNVPGAKWIVERFAFGGSGYEIGVAINSLSSICGVDGMFVDLDLCEPNKLKRLMHREYAAYASLSAAKTPVGRPSRRGGKQRKPNYGPVTETTRSTRTGLSKPTKTAKATKTTKTKKLPPRV